MAALARFGGCNVINRRFRRRRSELLGYFSLFTVSNFLGWIAAKISMWVGLESTTCSDKKLIEIRYEKVKKGESREKEGKKRTGISVLK